jgi:cob(I)alamin adenosyltransferase
MVVLSRIYTRTGDDGTTALGDFSRTAKTDPRLVAYADCDETGAAIGVAVACGDLPEELTTLLQRVQNDLFDVGADLCTPLAESYEHPPLRVQEAWIGELEQACDTYGEPLATLRSFVLAGGTVASAHLHVARTVARRAERSTWTAIQTYGTQAPGGVNPLTAQYLNRLSDLLFVLARYANHGRGGDVLWQPGGGRQAPPS